MGIVKTPKRTLGNLGAQSSGTYWLEGFKLLAGYRIPEVEMDSSLN